MRSFIVGLVALVVVACGGNGQGYDGAASGAGGATVATPEPTTSVAQQAAPPDDAGPAAPIPDEDAGSSSLVLRYSTRLDPGQESTEFALGAVLTEDTWINGWTARMHYVHHVGVWIVPSGGTFTATTCSGCSRLLFTALYDGFRQTIPVQGGAMLLQKGTQLVLDVHRLNLTSDPQDASASLTLDVAAEHTTQVYSSYVDGHTFRVAAHSTTTLTFTCDLPTGLATPLAFYSLIPHTHSHTTATYFSADGKEVYRSNNWSEPDTRYFNPPLAASRITWSCDIANNSDVALSWGLGRDSAEMCQFYAMATGIWSCAK